MLQNASVFADGLDHCECIAVHPDGSVWAGGEAGQIYRISPDGADIEEVATTGGFILGIAFSPGAAWMAICDLKHKCVWRMDMDSFRLTQIMKSVDGHDLNIPNYIAFDESGGFYLSDSGAFREINGLICYYSPEGESHIWHKGPVNFANGIALHRDWLYIVTSFMPGVERVRVMPDGTAGKREVFCTLPKTVPDGVAFDMHDNLYVSCYAPNRIYKVAPDRTTSVWIDDWEAHTLSNPTNIAFGGNQFDQLFTSNLGRWHITRIDAGVKGKPLVSHQ